MLPLGSVDSAAYHMCYALPKPTFTVQLFSFPCPLHHLVYNASLAQVCSETWSDCQSVLHELWNRNHHCMGCLFTLQRTIFSTTASIGKPAGVAQMATHGPLPSHIHFKFTVLSSHRESTSHHPTTTYFKMGGWCSQLGYVHPRIADNTIPSSEGATTMHP